MPFHQWLEYFLSHPKTSFANQPSTCSATNTTVCCSTAASTTGVSAVPIWCTVSAGQGGRVTTLSINNSPELLTFRDRTLADEERLPRTDPNWRTPRLERRSGTTV